MNKLTYLLFLSLLLTTQSCTSKSAKNHKRNLNQSSKEIHENVHKQGYYRVTKIVDGDTFWVYNFTTEGLKIRLIGIDAPESRNAFKKKKQPYGLESKAYMEHLLEEKAVRLEFDVDSLDQYGRTLAYAYLENGEMLNELMIKIGNAQILTITPNVKYEDLFITAQKYARENSFGLWAIEISE